MSRKRNKREHIGTIDPNCIKPRVKTHDDETLVHTDRRKEKDKKKCRKKITKEEIE
jgi:hypothetical protein